jgi:hypothetical protein
MVVTTFMSYIISRWLSSPLSLLEKKMSAVELGADNEKIDYPMVEGDVLSKLVTQYNLMIDKLGGKLPVDEIPFEYVDKIWAKKQLNS